MTFTVKHRAKDGTVREKCIEAADRSDCFAKCKSLGITPVSVKIGVISTPRRAVGGGLRIAVWFAVACVAAIVVGICLLNAKQEDQPPVKRGDIPKAKSIDVVAPSAPKQAALRQTATNRAPTAVEAKNLSMKDRHGFPQVVVDDTGREWYGGAPVPLLSGGVGWHKGKLVGSRRYFKYAAENYISDAIILNNGQRSFAPEPPKFDEAFEKSFFDSLKDTTPIEDVDDETAVYAKKQMVEVKKEILARINKGEKLKDILENYRVLTEEVGRMRENLQRIYDEMVKEGASDQERADHVEASNRLMMDKYGADGISLPRDVKRRLNTAKGEPKIHQQ